MEPGIGIIFSIVYFFSQSSFVIFFTISLLIFLFYYLIVKNLNLNPVTLLLIYICSGYFVFQQFMQIRQGLAAFLVLYASLCLFDRKYFLALSVFLFAIYTHQSSILPILSSIFIYILFIFCNFSKNKFIVINLIILLFVYFFSKLYLINYLIVSSERVESYTNISQYSGQVSFFGFNNIRILLLYLFIFFFFINLLLMIEK